MRTALIRSSSPWAWIRLVVFAILVTTASACRESPAPRRVLFILLDAARADRFSCYRYQRKTTPEMDKFGEKGVVFLKHFANGSATRFSMPTLIYSRCFVKPVFPYSPYVPLQDPDDLFRVLDPQCISLPRALSAHGIHTAGISSHPWLHVDTEFAKEFDEFRDLQGELEPGGTHPYVRADAIVDEAIAWLGDREPSGEFFLYLHFMDAHFPHLLDEDAKRILGTAAHRGQEFSPSGIPEDVSRALGSADRHYLDALYDGDLRFTDRELGRLFRFLEEREWLDDARIAITSDHGEHLAHVPDRLHHDGPWLDAVAHVPLMLFYPRRVTARRCGFLSQGVDVMPTILGLLDIGLPEGKAVDGEDLFRLRSDGGREWVFMENGGRSQEYKVEGLSPLSSVLGSEEPDLHSVTGRADAPGRIHGRRVTVSVHLNGRCRLTLGDVTMELEGQPLEGDLSRPMAKPEFGLAEVRNGLLRAHVEPDGRAGRLRFGPMGFTPEGQRAGTEADSERLEQLRALGYIQ